MATVKIRASQSLTHPTPISLSPHLPTPPTPPTLPSLSPYSLLPTPYSLLPIPYSHHLNIIEITHH
ncbi:MAG: hypothetical protein F6J99_30740 [Moorea sp. SIO4G3]|nr:hypothetical protein [Moorena sp. SIO4G3]